MNLPRCWRKTVANRANGTTDGLTLAPVCALTLALGTALLSIGCAAPSRCDAQALLAVEQAHRDRAEVTVCGTVVQIDRVRRSRSGAHRTFIVDAGKAGRIEVDANLAIMGDVPLRRGENAIVRGEYYADADGRTGVHWTHRTLRGSHPPGFIVLDGMTYQ